MKWFLPYWYNLSVSLKHLVQKPQWWWSITTGLTNYSETESAAGSLTDCSHPGRRIIICCRVCWADTFYLVVLSLWLQRRALCVFTPGQMCSWITVCCTEANDVLQKWVDTLKQKILKSIFWILKLIYIYFFKNKEEKHLKYTDSSHYWCLHCKTLT